METIIDIDECPICMDHGDHPIKELACCQHKICEKCYEKLPQRECPFCRQPFDLIKTPKQYIPFFRPPNIMCLFSGGCCCILFIVLFILLTTFSWYHSSY